MKKEDYNASILFHTSNAVNRTRIFFQYAFQRVPGWCEGTGRKKIHPLQAVQMKISQEVVGTGSPPLSGHMFNREAAGIQKRPDELEDVTERLTAIESAREVVTRRI